MRKFYKYGKLLMLSAITALAISIALPGSFIGNPAAKSTAASVSDTSDHYDPGAGRLSGKYIPDEFYEDAAKDSNTTNNGLNKNNFSRFGSVMTANQFTGNNYTHQDRFDNCTIINGIDISHYQSNIDWAQVKASGIEFAFIRVGGRGYGAEGKFYNDVDYNKNMEGATAAGVSKGIYIFSQATTTVEAEEEAQFILDRIGSYTVELPLVLDFEFASDSKGTMGRLKNAKLTKDDATAVCLAFCKKIQDAGFTPMVYANPDMLNNHLNADVISASYPIWLANYTTSTSYPGTFTYWQYASSGTVPGINGKVDMDFYYAAPTGDMAAAIVKPIDDQKYTGAPFTPELTVSINGTVLTNGIDYTAIYTNNTAIGTATVTITGINGYNGTRTITFNIIDDTVLPEIGDLSSGTRTKNSVTLQWSPTSDITGYEIYRSPSPNGEFSLIKTITKASTGTYKNTKLAEGQCYYYKIRTYKTTNGVTSYGNFSGVVGIYTKTSYTRLALPKSDTYMHLYMDVNSEIVESPEKNSFTKVTYCTYDDTGVKWYRVSYEGTSGFIPASSVTIAKQGKVKTSKVNVRKSAKLTAKKLTTVGKNKKVAIIKTKKTKTGTWYNVIFTKGSKTYKGYIYSVYVKI